MNRCLKAVKKEKEALAEGLCAVQNEANQALIEATQGWVVDQLLGLECKQESTTVMDKVEQSAKSTVPNQSMISKIHEE